MKAKDKNSKWESVGKTQEVVWRMRLADLPRSKNRDILNRTYNGEPPYDPQTAEENNIEVNRNFLEGTGNLTDARTQWNANFLKPGNVMTVALDCGPVHKKQEWSQIITKNLNRELKKSLGYITQARETGAGVLLHGIGPSYWSNRRSPIPKVMPISSLLIPSETDIDFENLEYFAIFREMTPAQLWEKTHGPKVDPGWNIPLVDREIYFIGQQVQKLINSTAFQFMPERITEIIKQDVGFWGSDAVPTVDYWDFYYREKDDGCGWYRKSFLDWESGGRDMVYDDKAYAPTGEKDPNGGQWLYDSGNRKYANSWSEIIHCNYGDCSCVAPFKYHSVRSLGWMIWGIVEINNRLQSKMTEQAFSDLMWFFRVASNNDFVRLKKANFLQMGVIPQGIEWIKGNERFSPNAQFLEMVLGQNRQLLSQHSSSFTRNAERTNMNTEKTATQVMAEVNSINTMVTGVMGLAKTYEGFKDREICRRYCIPNNPDPSVMRFRKACVSEGVPVEYLEVEKWDIDHEMAIGAGNRTVQMAIVQYLNSIRQNLGPEAQRKIDHIGIQIMTEDAAIAEDLAPTKGQDPISRSSHDAELTTERLMANLPLTPTPQMIYEDYVKVWLRDMGLIIKTIQAAGHMASAEQVMGLQNMATHISIFLQIMGQNQSEVPKVKEYSNLLGQLMNVVKGFAQRLAEQQQSANGNGANGIMAETAAKIQSDKIIAEAKAANLRESHADKTAQRTAQFQLEEQRKDQAAAADINRTNAVTAAQTAAQIRSEGVKAIAQEKEDTTE